MTSALVKKSAPRSTLAEDIGPAAGEMVRAICTARWDRTPAQRLQGYALCRRDRSPAPNPGEAATEEDQVNADLSWLGLPAGGNLTRGDHGSSALSPDELDSGSGTPGFNR